MRRLRVITFEDDANAARFSARRTRLDDPMVGYEAELLGNLMRSTGFEYDILHYNISNVDQMKEYIRIGLADIGLPQVLCGNETYLAYLNAFDFLEVGFITMEEPDIYTSAYIFAPLELWGALLVLLSVIVLSILAVTMTALITMWKKKDDTIRTNYWWAREFIAIVTHLAGLLFRQGTRSTFKGNAVRVLVAIYAIAAYLITFHYEFTLQAELSTFTVNPIPFRTFSGAMDHVEAGGWEFVVCDDGGYKPTSTSVCVGDQCKRAAKLQHKEIHVKTFAEMEQQLTMPRKIGLYGEVSAVIPSPVMFRHKAKGQLFTVDQSIPMRPHAHKQLQIMAYYARVYEGYSATRARYEHLFSSYPLQRTLAATETISKEHLSLILYGYCAGLAICIGVFVVECVFPYIQRQF